MREGAACCTVVLLTVERVVDFEDASIHRGGSGQVLGLSDKPKLSVVVKLEWMGFCVAED